MISGFFVQLRPSWALPQLKVLALGENNLGDDGVAALALACASGALPKLAAVRLTGNPGDAKPVNAVNKVLRERMSVRSRVRTR